MNKRREESRCLKCFYEIACITISRIEKIIYHSIQNLADKMNIKIYNFIASIGLH